MDDISYLKKYLPVDKYEEGILKLNQGVPVQYIVGDVNFCGNIIGVDESVLIPRFETELLVDKTVCYIKKYFDGKVDVLDIGTGSGCIAISVFKRVLCNMDATDISDDAIRVAKANALLNGAGINFYQSDLFSNVNGRFDVIISNPPYIAYDEKIEDKVRYNEPSIALFADNDGLEFYQRILDEASNYVKDKFIIAFEIGYKQGGAVEKMAQKIFPLANVSVQKDYTGRDRFVFILQNTM